MVSASSAWACLLAAFSSVDRAERAVGPGGPALGRYQTSGFYKDASDKPAWGMAGLLMIYVLLNYLLEAVLLLQGLGPPPWLVSLFLLSLSSWHSTCPCLPASGPSRALPTEMARPLSPWGTPPRLAFSAVLLGPSATLLGGPCPI